MAFGEGAWFYFINPTDPRAWEIVLPSDVFGFLKFLSYKSFNCLVRVSPKSFLVSSIHDRKLLLP